MNYVQLVDGLRIESGASGREILTLDGSLPAETQRLKRWIDRSFNDIQIKHTDWNFLFVESSHTLTTGITILNPPEYQAGEVAEWMLHTFRIAEPLGLFQKSERMNFIEYYQWRYYDALDTTRIQKPQSFTVHPQTEAIQLTSTPDQNYELFYTYRRTPQVLASNTDVPIIPVRFHELIVAWALRSYGWHEVAPEKLQQAKEQIDLLFPMLEMDQLPDVETVPLL